MRAIFEIVIRKLFSHLVWVRRSFWTGLCLALLVLIAYWGVWNCGFVNFDDDLYITENPQVQKGLTWDGFHWAFTTGYSCNWHPLTWISHMIDCQAYALRPSGHHLTNLLFHLLNTLLLLAVLRKMTGSLWRSAVVAALFALHPLHVESVAWVSERKDVLSTLFWLVTMFAYTSYAQTRSWWAYVLSLISFALGLMSKPMLVTLPFVLLLLDVWPLHRLILPWPREAGSIQAGMPPVTFTRTILEKIPFFLLAISSSIVTFLVQRAGGAMATAGALPISQRVDNALVSYVRYLGKMIFPSGLNVFYRLHPEIPGWQVWTAVSILAVITLWIVLKFREYPHLLVGWCWFLGTLVPVIGLIQVGRQAIADRYTYIPSIGIFIMAAWSLPELLKPRLRLISSFAAGMVLLFCVTLTQKQVETWRSGETLFKRALAVDPNNEDAHNILGLGYIKQKRYAEAREEFDASLRVQPYEPLTFYYLGMLYWQQKQFTNSLPFFRAALKGDPQMSKVHGYIGTILFDEGQLEEARPHVEKALEVEPNNVELRKSLGLILARQNDVTNAITHFNEALRLQPKDPEIHYYLGLAYLIQGNPQAAEESYRKAINLKPDWPAALNDLAWLLATQPRSELRNGAEAVTLASKACSLTQDKETSYLGTLDASYAEAGRFQEAMVLAKRVQEMASASGAQKLAEAAEKRLQLYRLGQPYHEP